jgi:hypothetical protein
MSNATIEEAYGIKKDYYERDSLYREYLISIREPVPCVIYAEGLIRKALLTDEEIAELRKAGIYVENPQEYILVPMTDEWY